ncbi:hypothetical protein [Emticicia fontis]
MKSEITERITRGMSVQLTDADSFEEPVSLSEIKRFISMDASLGVHDDTLNALNTACRRLVEDKLGISLIPRSVVVSWREFYDFSKLPYLPVQAAGAISVTDLSDTEIAAETYSWEGVGGFFTIVGDFAEGVKISYQAGGQDIDPIHQQMIKSMVHEVFVNKTPMQKALAMHVNALPI